MHRNGLSRSPISVNVHKPTNSGASYCGNCCPVCKGKAAARGNDPLSNHVRKARLTYLVPIRLLPPMLHPEIRVWKAASSLLLGLRQSPDRDGRLATASTPM